MNDINACFISYRHPGDPGADKYVRRFKEVLATHLSLYLPNARVFLDENRLGVGDFFEPMLAQEICRSACMVMFYGPCHFETGHPFCALEYHAMLDLEAKRLPGVADLRNQGLIFPVVLRGTLPPEIGDTRHALNLDQLIVCDSDFRKPRCQAQIKDLAQRIFDRYQKLMQANVFAPGGCDSFAFRSKESIADWLKRVSPTAGYPGR